MLINILVRNKGVKQSNIRRYMTKSYVISNLFSRLASRQDDGLVCAQY